MSAKEGCLEEILINSLSLALSPPKPPTNPPAELLPVLSMRLIDHKQYKHGLDAGRRTRVVVIFTITRGAD